MANSNITSVATNIASVNTAATNLTSINSFANTYLGPSSSAPTADPDGSALDVGDLYFDTTANVMKVYSSGGWVTAASAVNGTSNRFHYSISSSTTTVTGADDNSKTLAYDAGFVDVYLNGVRLTEGDITTTSGSSIVFAKRLGVSGTDEVDVVAYGTFQLTNFSVGDANNVDLASLATNDLLQYNGTNFVPKNFDEVTPTQSSHSGKFLTTDGTNASWGTVNTNLVADTSPQLGGNLDGNGNTIDLGANNTSLGLPVGSTAEQPSADAGQIRYDTDKGAVMYSDGSTWFKISSVIPTLSSVIGNILNGTAGNLTLNGEGFLSANLVVSFTPSGGSASTVTVTPTTDVLATVAVPSAIYGQSISTVIGIKVTNSDGNSSATVNKTVTALPTGGTISNISGYRVHTFNSSANFVTYETETLEYLIVAGGGCGGHDVGGGGGAGGMLTGSVSKTASTYSIVIGAGGAGHQDNATQNNGTNSTALGLTTIGGGGGGNWNNSGNSTKNGADGGSGGGAGGWSQSATGGNGTSGQGNDGGDAPTSQTGKSGGGGGGAGGAGQNEQGTNSQDTALAGIGAASSITGSSVTYAVGGTGGNDYSYGSQADGETNKGGGGDGAGGAGSSSGGSGVVIIRYAV